MDTPVCDGRAYSGDTPVTTVDVIWSFNYHRFVSDLNQCDKHIYRGPEILDLSQPTCWVIEQYDTFVSKRLQVYIGQGE